MGKLKTSVVRYPRYLDTYRRYLRDDTSITKVTIYRGISLQYKIPWNGTIRAYRRYRAARIT